MDKNKCNSCGKPKCSCKNKEFTKAVVEINNPEQITLMRKVVIPASMGDDTTVPPVVGKYKNVLLFYEANSKSYLYSSDGIPTQLVNGITDYEQAVNLPQINGVTLLGDKSSADLKLAGAPVVVHVTNNNMWSSDKTSQEIYELFNSGVNVVVEFDERPSDEKTWPVLQLGYDENNGTLIGIIAIGYTELEENTWNSSFVKIDFRANRTVASTEIRLQEKLTAGDGIEIEDNTISISEIEQYAHFFDTVADMKSATNLVAGDYARTGGFYTVNDGGSATYYITDSGTANEKDVITVGDLYAILVTPAVIVPEIYGAYGDDTHDDTQAIQFALDKQLPILFEKNYVISSTLVISGDGLDIATKPTSKITYSGDTYAIKITDCSRSNIELGSIDALSGSCINLYCTNNSDRVANITLKTDNLRALNYCIRADETNVSEGYINEIRITGGRWMSGNVGLYMSSYRQHSAGMNDWKIYNVMVEGVTTGIEIYAQTSARIDAILLSGLRYKESYTNLVITHGQVYSLLFIGAGRFNVGDFHPTYFNLSDNTYGAIVAPYEDDQMYFYNILKGRILRMPYQFPTTISTSVGSPADLNNYLNCGKYVCDSNVSTLLNSPTTSAFEMDVSYFNGTFRIQTITERNTGNIYHRLCRVDGTNYYSWYKLETTQVV